MPAKTGGIKKARIVSHARPQRAFILDAMIAKVVAENLASHTDTILVLTG